MRAYLSYPISGLDIVHVRANSKRNKEILQAGLGWDIVNPTEVFACPDCVEGNVTPGHEHSWQEWMKADLAEMLACDAIIMCYGWQTSPGARMEFYLAVSAGLTPHLLVQGGKRPIVVDMTNGSMLML